MGYLSEVVIRCGKNVFKELDGILERCSLFPDDVRVFNDEYLLHWYWIKWYDTYSVIQEVDSVLNDFISKSKEWSESEDNKEDSFFFIRMGEQYGDVETKSNNNQIMEMLPIWTIDIGFASNWQELSPTSIYPTGRNSATY